MLPSVKEKGEGESVIVHDVMSLSADAGDTNGFQGEHLGRWGRGGRQVVYLLLLLNFEWGESVTCSAINQLNENVSMN